MLIQELTVRVLNILTELKFILNVVKEKKEKNGLYIKKKVACQKTKYMSLKKIIKYSKIYSI